MRDEIIGGERVPVPEDSDDLCAPFLAALPVDGVSISTLGDPFGSETISASDDTAARLDEIQLDLGEGPCWDAMRTDTPVLTPDLGRTTIDGWPAALIAMRESGLAAVFAFPMRIGPIRIGAVDLYTKRPSTLTPQDAQHAAALSRVAALHILDAALNRAETEAPGDWPTGRYSRQAVHQAAGMVAAQTGVHADAALQILRASAYASGRSVLDVSAAVIDGLVDLTDSDHPMHGL